MTIRQGIDCRGNGSDFYAGRARLCRAEANENMAQRELRPPDHQS